MLHTLEPGTVRPNFKPETNIIARMADACRDMGPNFATRDRLRDEYGFSDLEIDLYGVGARTRANADFVRQAHEAAQDDLAREDVEGTRRTLLVSIPVADICQAWQGLRSGAGCSTLEATARIVESFDTEAHA
ncbi:hypothetical protein [Pelagibacterium montanilacus]|uniref:hypothetical protein n=1 Tax=Pelagibacterium montanilacus TaxID=2185280 RepID=UPI000F8DD7A2|nr:hypothetical protein [Pelagibacterium montanilacus]